MFATAAFFFLVLCLGAGEGMAMDVGELRGKAATAPEEAAAPAAAEEGAGFDMVSLRKVHTENPNSDFNVALYLLSQKEILMHAFCCYSSRCDDHAVAQALDFRDRKVPSDILRLLSAARAPVKRRCFLAGC